MEETRKWKLETRIASEDFGTQPWDVVGIYSNEETLWKDLEYENEMYPIEARVTPVREA